jgi:hypothetical protein
MLEQAELPMKAGEFAASSSDAIAGGVLGALLLGTSSSSC